MDVRALSAANAYAAALGRTRVAPERADGDTPDVGAKGGFADLLKQAAGDVTQTTKAAEQMSIAGATGRAELVDVVAAVTNAEMTLETVVAVRDKVIAAYQEVMRMQMMQAPEVIDVARDAITVLLQVSGPIMAVGLVVGLVVSLIQAITHVQEMTLAFVPKILAIFASLILFAPFMLSQLTSFMERIAARIAQVG